MLKKLNFILKNTEKIHLLLLSITSIFLSFSEVFSVATIIPIVTVFLDQSIITKSPIIKWIYFISGSRDNSSFIFFLSISAILIFILKSIFDIIVNYWQQKFICKVDTRLRSSLLDYYLSENYAFHLTNNSSSLFKNLNAEVNQFVSYILESVIHIITEILVMTGLFSLLMILYPLITLLFLFLIGGEVFCINIFLKKRINKYALLRSILSEDYYRYALEAFNAIKEIKIYNVQNMFIRRFIQAYSQFAEVYIKSTILSLFPRHILQTTIFSASLIIVLINIHIGKSNTEIISMMTIIIFVSMRIVPSITRLSVSLNYLQYSQKSLDIIYDSFLQERKNTSLRNSAIANNMAIDNIELKGIDFAYTDTQNPIFEKISLTINKKKITAFAGKTGCGKSTLLDIIMGLLEPYSGEIYYGNNQITPYNILNYRKKIGYVPQSIYLLDDSIAVNIAFGISQNDIDYEKIHRAVKISQLETFINELPQGLDTIVGEKGVRLSGGQIQRIGIARALYLEPDLIVLDEATSALDVHTEYDFMRSIIDLGKTIILVTHRIETLKNADYIYLLDHGKIIDCGNYDEILNRTDFFKNIITEN